MKYLRFSYLLTLLCVVSWALFSFGQSETGQIAGTVTDQTGAVVPGATISITNTATNRVITVQSGASGQFSAPALLPGHYKVEVKAANFKTVSQEVTLEVNQVLPMDFSMPAGSTTENVEVTSAAPLVSTDSSDIGQVIQGRQVVDLPLNARNFTQLATLVPGVTRGNNTNGDATGASGNAETYRYNNSGGASLAVNGLRPQANNFLLDGFDNNESLVNTIVFFSAPDAIQEFRVATNIAPAEFGRAGGGIVNTAIKSGTNQIHGTLWEFFRNSALDATQWEPTPNAKKLPFKQNQFGAAAGAPIIKDKLFIFGDYQGFRSSYPVSTDYATVPTDVMRASGYRNFSELLGSGIVIRDPQTGCAVSRQHHSFLVPLEPGGGKLSECIPDSELRSGQQPELQRHPAELHHHPSGHPDDQRFRHPRWITTSAQKDTSFFRYSYGNDNLTTASRLPDLPAGFGSGTNPTHPYAAVIEETHLFSSNLVNEARFGFIHDSFGYTPPFNNEPLSANLGIVNANVNALGQPDPELGGGALIGGYNSQLEYTGDYGPYLVPQDTWQDYGQSVLGEGQAHHEVRRAT